MIYQLDLQRNARLWIRHGTVWFKFGLLSFSDDWNLLLSGKFIDEAKQKARERHKTLVTVEFERKVKHMQRTKTDTGVEIAKRGFNLSFPFNKPYKISPLILEL